MDTESVSESIIDTVDKHVDEQLSLKFENPEESVDAKNELTETKKIINKLVNNVEEPLKKDSVTVSSLDVPVITTIKEVEDEHVTKNESSKENCINNFKKKEEKEECIDSEQIIEEDKCAILESNETNELQKVMLPDDNEVKHCSQDAVSSLQSPNITDFTDATSRSEHSDISDSTYATADPTPFEEQMISEEDLLSAENETKLRSPESNIENTNFMQDEEEEALHQESSPQSTFKQNKELSVTKKDSSTLQNSAVQSSMKCKPELMCNQDNFFAANTYTSENNNEQTNAESVPECDIEIIKKEDITEDTIEQDSIEKDEVSVTLNETVKSAEPMKLDNICDVMKEDINEIKDISESHNVINKSIDHMNIHDSSSIKDLTEAEEEKLLSPENDIGFPLATSTEEKDSLTKDYKDMDTIESPKVSPKQYNEIPLLPKFTEFDDTEPEKEYHSSSVESNETDEISPKDTKKDEDTKEKEEKKEKEIEEKAEKEETEDKAKIGEETKEKAKMEEEKEREEKTELEEEKEEKMEIEEGTQEKQSFIQTHEQKEEMYTGVIESTIKTNKNILNSLQSVEFKETLTLNSEKTNLITEELETFKGNKNTDAPIDSTAILENTNETLPQFSEEEEQQNDQDIITSILDPVTDVTDFKNILEEEEENIEDEIDKVLQDTTMLSTTEKANTEELMKATSQELIDNSQKNTEQEDAIGSQNIDSLEGLLNLDLIPEDSKCIPEEDSKVEDIETFEQTQNVLETKSDNSAESLEAPNLLESPEHIKETIDEYQLESNKESSSSEEIYEKVEASSEEISPIKETLIVGAEDDELSIDFVQTLESAVSPEKDVKITSPCTEETSDCTASTNIAPNSDISELESAVKFLQESEEQALDSPLALSPKMVENMSKENTLFPQEEEDMCEDASELMDQLRGISSDSISISEAEIISEAAKLESERKLAEQLKMNDSIDKAEQSEVDIDQPEAEKSLEKSEETPDIVSSENVSTTTIVNPTLTSIVKEQKLVKVSDSQSFLLPKASILEERLKEPPKIEIPMPEVSKMCETEDSLLIPKDANLTSYQKSLDSPVPSDCREIKVDTPKKDAEKHDFENVGSPRIILKIAKSAIADCGDPRSPKSPKIRSATNSPNPEDSPGQKLGKIKLKLSKGGHPSIISNENVEECSQWHSSEGSTSLSSPIGMKIKLSKSGDASIVEKHEEETKRTESPLGMKIKLSKKSGDASIVQQDIPNKYYKEVQTPMQASPKRTDSPIGMKIKLSKSGDASIVTPCDNPNYKIDQQSELDDNNRQKDKVDCVESPKRIESPLGMKLKLSKSGDVTIVSPDMTAEESKKDKAVESSPETPKRTDSPLGMKIKLSKTKSGSTSILSIDSNYMEEGKEKLEISELPKRTESPLGMKIKLSKSGDASIVHSEFSEESANRESKENADLLERRGCELSFQDTIQKAESIGMKIKFSKSGDASVVLPDKPDQLDIPQESYKRTESPIGMKIKLSKTGDASIIQQSESSFEGSTKYEVLEYQKPCDATSPMKVKLASPTEDKKERQQKRKENDSSLEMKIKLSKTGHPTIVSCDSLESSKEAMEGSQSFVHRHKESTSPLKDLSPLRILKANHSAIVQSNRSELTIEPIHIQAKKLDCTSMEVSSKRKETVTISPVESKKSKLEAQLSQILPEVTIQPVLPQQQKQLNLFDPKTSSSISRQQMNVISQEISITQVRPPKTNAEKACMSDKLKDILCKNTSSSPLGSDCEIIEHRPELIIVNENSNSSQDVMIIEEVPAQNRIVEVKTPKKRGRPRRNPLPPQLVRTATQLTMSRDPLAIEEAPQVMGQLGQRENERPKRTCRSQKSYAPPRRGRGRGRGKRKFDATDASLVKKARVEQDLNAIEASTMAVITLDESTPSQQQQQSIRKSTDLYRNLKQPPIDMASCKESLKQPSATDSMNSQLDSTTSKNERCKIPSSKASGQPNCWLTPMSKKPGETIVKSEATSSLQVIDEETRMSAESGSRSQTPARNIPTQAAETIVNEESQGSVLSTATTESEKVKVKNRRMEINFDPDEGPFTVDKIAEYEWPLDRKGETFMIQEQISQYLGVKSFKRKYPDLKRRVVDMEERNYLRENGLVSEAMCDMGLTAVCSSEVLDIMCSDFPDQYEEYRKHMREKQAKEHSKKQKELTAAANAERNRIDLAEMAVQSALTWNINLNKSRRENRKCSLDLQTFTIHVPRKQQKVQTDRRISHYPVALIPGQYTDYYREYTAAELRYYPLNTVLYGPTRPNERKFDSQSEGSQSDSDSDSSTDDSSSSSSEGTQDTEESQSTMEDIDMEMNNQQQQQQKEDSKAKCKICFKTLNKHSKNEVLIQCGTCNGNVHPSCIELTLDMVPHIQSYAWQCTDCKTCVQCHDPADEDKMLFCDMCDRGYHIYCVGLRRVPVGRWHCQECAVCANCGSREPGGQNSDRNSVAQWQHEYKKGDKNIRVYVSTLCVPCSKLRGEQRVCVR